jgi:hypothetical protein
MDTITLIRSAIRSLLRVADGVVAAELRAALGSDDDYASVAKPQIDWDDAEARDALIDSRARDGLACLRVLEGRQLGPEVAEAAELLATVLGQDLEETDDGTLRIARGVARDRVISTVDPEARHGHKTAARGFDGYKGHAAIDPDSEIITDTTVTPGNVGDANVAGDLIDDLIEDDATDDDAAANAAATDFAGDSVTDTTATPSNRKKGAGGGRAKRSGRGKANKQTARTRRAESRRAARTAALERKRHRAATNRPTVYGDAAYGTGEFLEHLAEHGIESRCKTQAPTAPGGLFVKDRFVVDLDADTVTCPNQVTVTIRRGRDGDGTAYFADACAGCALRARCTNAAGGRTIRVGRHEQRLAHARGQQQDPEWAADYRSTRPKVERKLAHMMRRKHGARRARVRGLRKVDADFSLLAAAHNIARLAVLGLRSTLTGWEMATT